MAIVQTLKTRDAAAYWHCVDMARDGRSASYIAGYVAGRIQSGTLNGNYRASDLLATYKMNPSDYLAGMSAA